MASHISKAACFWLWLLGDRRDGHFDLSCHVRLSTRISTRPAFDLSVVDLSSTSTCCCFCFCFCFYCLCCIALPEKLNRARKNYAPTWTERTRKDRSRRTLDSPDVDSTTSADVYDVTDHTSLPA